MKSGRWLVVLGLLAAAAAGPAAAQDPGLYVGGSLGFVQYKETCKDLLVPCDDKDTGWRAFGGYQLNRYVAAELGFADLGELTGDGPLAGGGQGSLRAEIKEAFDLSAVFSFPVSSYLSGLARVGMYRARTTVDVEVTGFAPTSDGGTNSGFTFGLGAEARLGRLGVRAEWQHYDNVGVASTGEDDIDVFSIGVLFRF
ncbi:MAG TPA: outer membrane beta-barrel protein [Burkholderiales bacterium]|nr:outer membrane beta-barrel protein [Burkholderiales bacterium]